MSVSFFTGYKERIADAFKTGDREPVAGDSHGIASAEFFIHLPVDEPGRHVPDREGTGREIHPCMVELTSTCMASQTSSRMPDFDFPVCGDRH
jgi:hypothetical protein